MAEIRPSNRRDFVRLRMYGVACEFTANTAVQPGSPLPAAGVGEPPAKPAAARVPGSARPEGPRRNAPASIAGGRYSELLGQIYRSDRIVRIERRAALPALPAGPEQPPPDAPCRAGVTGKLIDVGGGGARFALREGDWPIRSRPSGRLAFEISGQRFEFACELVRKTENRSTVEYVAAWRRPRPADIDRLMRAIFQIELTRRQPPVPAVPEPRRRRRRLAFDTRAAAWAIAGLAAGAAASLFAAADAVPVLGGLAAMLLIGGLLAR